MISMIPKVNSGVEEIRFMFCDSHIPLKLPFVGGYKFEEPALSDLYNIINGDGRSVRPVAILRRLE